MSDSDDTRREAMRELEESRGSRLIAYFLGDRYPFRAQIAEDAVRPFYEHLKDLQFETRRKTVDLFLYGRGGSAAAAARIVGLLRDFADEVDVLIPYKCHNAASLMAMGADRILMGPLGELTAVDPCVGEDRLSTGGLQTEPMRLAGDLKAFLSMLKSTVRSEEHSALSRGALALSQGMDAAEMGAVQRVASHFSPMARNLLAARREKLSEQEMRRIIDAMTEKLDPHLSRIDRSEAKEIGLKLQSPKPEWEEPMDTLFREYERALRLNDPISPEAEMEAIIDAKNTENIPLAILESGDHRHVFRASLALRKIRRIPAEPEINVNLSMKLAPEPDPERFSAEMRTLLGNLKKQAQRNIHSLVQREIQRQSPVVDVQISLYDGRWVEEG